jgi:hypothetical protein
MTPPDMTEESKSKIGPRPVFQIQQYHVQSNLL